MSEITTNTNSPNVTNNSPINNNTTSYAPSSSVQDKIAIVQRRMNSAFYGLMTIGGIGILSWIIMVLSGLAYGPNYKNVGSTVAGSPATVSEAIMNHFKEYSWMSMLQFSVVFFVVPMLFCLGCYVFYLSKINKMIGTEINKIKR